jgi:hypothetical protein
MSVWALATSLWLAASLTLFSVWCVRTYATTELPRDADRTSQLLWLFGKYAIWAAAGLTVLLAFTLTAYVVARAIGG